MEERRGREKENGIEGEGNKEAGRGIQIVTQKIRKRN